jgi:hypothetical protein
MKSGSELRSWCSRLTSNLAVYAIIDNTYLTQRSQGSLYL